MAVILCIDNYIAGLEMRRAFLEATGHTVLIASDGRTGIEIADRGPLDLVLLDYEMPGMDGEQTAIVLKRRHPNLPIILLTGFVGDLPERLLRLVDAYIQKGEPPGVLLSAVEICGRRRSA